MTVEAVLLPEDPIVGPVLEIVRTEESAPVANHSIRSYLFARLLARHRGWVVAERTLFAACVLHDIGLTVRGNGRQRFEVDGADAAEAILAPLGVPAAERALIWEAIALHTSPGIAERRGPLADLTRSGVGVDFGRGSTAITDAQAAAIHAAYPRLELTTALVDEIVGQAQGDPSKAAPYTLAGELTRERATGTPTRLEQGALTARWGN
ncbi:HD domain-containing protein [Nocardia sp. alder85J]|uniref:HD domain-containing protein n=1 Tax=Nocardia sp. alder85J TaxID=2862949 RepID=UPI001CD48395|nr:HD domain-containing protein [Nocardia sp. alder85J]MCX4093229.1 HD domain-containing protein [Nocardia sp. alder85J]